MQEFHKSRSEAKTITEIRHCLRTEMSYQSKIRHIPIEELRKRTGNAFVDGRNVRLAYDLHGRTVQEGDEQSSGDVHREQQRLGQAYFSKKGYRLFPYQIGVEG